MSYDGFVFIFRERVAATVVGLSSEGLAKEKARRLIAAAYRDREWPLDASELYENEHWQVVPLVDAGGWVGVAMPWVSSAVSATQ